MILIAQVAQLVEHVTENHGVGGSIPPLGTNNINVLRDILYGFRATSKHIVSTAQRIAGLLGEHAGRTWRRRTLALVGRRVCRALG